ncbi:MAG: CDP-alcohol phosphatidyltransferase family protein [Verrucomicrobia bacterium]|nr:CDP-alcohol phosphatidyltransferase family protein [Verrucomicrobiota bacterium]
MIEATLRKTYQKYCVDPLLRLKVFRKVHPIALTLLACLVGVSALPLLSLGFTTSALFFLIASGVLDTLDGSLARQDEKTSNQGAALDITCDRLVEFAVILGLFFIEPFSRGLPSLLMLGSVLICVTSFLIVGIFTQNSSEKSFHYSPGLIERAEAFFFFAAMILFPTLFNPLAYLFSILVLLTAAIRLVQFFKQSA